MTEPETQLPHFLEEAVRSLEQGDHVSAVERLVEAWRINRQPSLAAIACCAAALSPTDDPRVLGKMVKDQHSQWLAIARSGDTSKLGLLLATLTKHKAPMAAERIGALRAFSPDPRIAYPLTRLVLAPPFQSTGGRRFWTALFKMLVEHGDQGTHDALSEVAGTFVERLGAETMGTFFNRAVDKLLQDLGGKLAKRAPKELSAEEQVSVRRVEQLLEEAGRPTAAEKRASESAEQGERLLEAVAANPEEDGPKLVCADWLLERSDPRGEFISLQFKARNAGLTDKEAKRVRALQKKHGADWIGPLAAIAPKSDVVFERGFLQKFRFHPHRDNDAVATEGSLAWATVEELEIDAYRGGLPPNVLAHPVTRSLRKITNLPLECLFALAFALVPRPLAWISVVCGFTSWGGQRVDDVARENRSHMHRCPGVPLLTTLKLVNELPPSLRELNWLSNGDLGRQLRHLVLNAPQDGIAQQHIESLHHHPCAIPRIDIRLKYSALRLRHASDGHHSVAELMPYASTMRDPGWDMAAMLRTLPAGCITQFVVPQKSPWPTDEVVAAASSIKGVEIVKS